jgi:hypothetical protein
MLLEVGVKEEILRWILLDNPGRFLAFVPRNQRKPARVQTRRLWCANPAVPV